MTTEPLVLKSLADELVRLKDINIQMLEARFVYQEQQIKMLKADIERLKKPWYKKLF